MRILIVDDDRLVCEMLREYVQDCGHDVVETISSGGLAAIQSYSRHRPDLVLLDILMPHLNGFTVCQNVCSRYPEARIILMSGQLAADYPSVGESGAVAFIQKPFRFEELKELLAILAGEQSASDSEAQAA